MERKFILSCCSTVDLPTATWSSAISRCCFTPTFSTGRNTSTIWAATRRPAPVYRFLQEGKLPQTSQINVATYLDFFEQQLQHGDLLHLSFTSGQSARCTTPSSRARCCRRSTPIRRSS